MLLPGQRAQLDREHHDHAARHATHEIRGARKRRSAGDAAQSEQRHALDVGPETQAIAQPRVDRRRRETGDGREHDGVDVARREAGAFERGAHGALPELEGVLDPQIVELPEGFGALVLLERQHEVTRLDAAGAEQCIEPRNDRRMIAPDACEPLDDFFLGVDAGRERAGDRGDLHALSRGKRYGVRRR